MNAKDALKIAEEIAKDRCSVTMHKGTTKFDRGIRLSGCMLDDARTIGHEIADRLPGGAYRDSDGFSCVWYDVQTDWETEALRNMEW